MSYVVGTQVRPSEPEILKESVASLVRPKLTAAGAQYVACLETVAGGNPGEFTIGSRWDSLDTAFSALKDFYSDADVVAALEASPVETVGRVVTGVEGEQGDCDGTYAAIVAGLFSSPDPARMGDLVGDMHQVVSSHGCRGVRLLQILAGGEQTGVYGTFIYTDSVDSFFDAMKATYSNQAMMSHFTEMGIQIVGRSIAVAH
jgi:hypothetical protein